MLELLKDIFSPSHFFLSFDILELRTDFDISNLLEFSDGGQPFARLLPLRNNKAEGRTHMSQLADWNRAV